LRLFRRCRPTLICAPISHGIATLAKFDSFAADVAFTHHSRTGRQAMETLKNKRAIVTGGSKGLGLAIVEALLAREAEVVAIARDEEQFGPAREAGAQMIAGDATDADLMNRLIVEQAPDILILNAGARLPMKPIDQQSWSEFSEGWNADVKAGLAGIPGALRTLMKSGGRVLIMSSGGDGARRAVHSAREPEAFRRL
jgi:NAD(P)-dependent dehydrogenase (short-subunit alcohol dehydrogenase family)